MVSLRNGISYALNHSGVKAGDEEEMRLSERKTTGHYLMSQFMKMMMMSIAIKMNSKLYLSSLEGKKLTMIASR